MFFAEGEALEIYQQAGCDPASPVPPEELAKRLLGSSSVLEQTHISTAAAWCEERSELWIRPKTPSAARSWLVAHELAERHLQLLGYRESNTEAFANRIAAALIAPAPAARRALRVLDRDYAALAEAFDTTQSIIALRVAEVTGQPTALLMPARIHVRGDPWGWPDEANLRRLVSTGAPPQGNLKTKNIQHIDGTYRLLLIAD